MADPNIEGNAGGTLPANNEPNHLRRAIIIWAVLSVIGIILVIVTSPFVLPPSVTQVGVDDNFTMELLTILAVPVSLFVFVFLGYSLIVFRVNGKPTEDAIPQRPRPGLQLGWFGITSVLCLFLVIYGLGYFYQEASAASTNTLAVQVTGQQWMWTFNYPQYSATSTGAQVIELPVNRPVEFYVTSKDVLHGFALRAFGIRVDANPGEVTTTPLVTPTQIGTYAVVCVELCGLYHSYMWESVKVVDTATFNAWITSQGGHP